MKRDPSCTRYVRAVERMWAERVDRAVVLSPRDWKRVAGWHASGVPLAVVREALDAATRRRQGTLRSLGTIAAAVEEAWQVVRDGRVAERDAPGEVGSTHDRPTPDDPPAAAGWRRAAAAAPDTPLAALLVELLERLERGEPLARLDAELDAALPDRVAPERRAEAEAAVRARLAAHRHRMSEERRASTARRALIERLRRGLGLERLETP